MRPAIGFIFGFFATFGASALTSSPTPLPQDCALVVAATGVVIESCDQGRLARVSLPNASFIASQAAPTARASMFKSFYSIPASASVDTASQAALREVLLTDESTLRRFGVWALTDFLANFVEPNSPLENYDGNVARGRFATGIFLITEICEFVGQWSEATYDDKAGNVFVELAEVGVASSRCRGRCGFGCANYLKGQRNQYTQQCFDHDVCHRSLKQNLGACANEFWRAVASYLTASNCSTR